MAPSLLGEVEARAAVYKEAVLVVDEVREALYVAIVAAVEQGIPAARVGRHAGLSRERVRQICEARGVSPGDSTT